MLRVVGNAVVVNPDRELGRVAKQEGWRVMRFERLGHKLGVGVALVAAGVAGGLVARSR